MFMNCVNCDTPKVEASTFCPNCGNKYNIPRLTFRSIFNEIVESAFGWDNKFFRTLKTLVISPEEVFNSYLGGARKKFANPFGLLAIGAFISVIVFSVFMDSYLEGARSANESFGSNMEKIFGANLDTADTTGVQQKNNPIVQKFGSQEQFQDWVNKGVAKYMNVFAFLMLPFYSLLSFLVYKRKGHFYGEHMAMNAYIQGFIAFISVVFFLVFLNIDTSPYLFQMGLTILIYLYVFKRLYKQTFSQVIISFFRFLLFFIFISFILMVILFIIGAAGTFFYMKLTK